jgi:hypothetical protein
MVFRRPNFYWGSSSRWKPGRAGHQMHLENLGDNMDRGSIGYIIPESSLASLGICRAGYLSARHHVW